MSTVKKARDGLFEATKAAGAAHKTKAQRHAEHLAKLKKEREQAEAERVAEIVRGTGA